VAALADVQPTRLVRAQQELADLLERNRGVRIGVIGFASVAHVVAPVTEDMNSIRRVLPALDSRLVKLQGSRLVNALDRAAELLAGQPAESVNSLLIITDGDFDEPGLAERLQAFAEEGVRVHVLGVGTPEGDAVPGSNDVWFRDRSGQLVVYAPGSGMSVSTGLQGSRCCCCCRCFAAHCRTTGCARHEALFDIRAAAWVGNEPDGCRGILVQKRGTGRGTEIP
jgi:hypothetical protein